MRLVALYKCYMSLPFAGQRVRLRAIVVSPTDDPLASDDYHKPVDGPDTCPETLVVHDSALLSTIRLPVCSSHLRDSQIYLSVGHRISVHVQRSRVQLERPGKAGETPSPSAASVTRDRRSGFLLTYECQYITQRLENQLFIVFVVTNALMSNSSGAESIANGRQVPHPTFTHSWTRGGTASRRTANKKLTKVC